MSKILDKIGKMPQILDIMRRNLKNQILKKSGFFGGKMVHYVQNSRHFANFVQNFGHILEKNQKLKNLF